MKEITLTYSFSVNMDVTEVLRFEEEDAPLEELMKTGTSLARATKKLQDAKVFDDVSIDNASIFNHKVFISKDTDDC